MGNTMEETVGRAWSARTRRRGAGGPWACHICSFENPWLNAACEICLALRPSAREGAATGGRNLDSGRSQQHPADFLLDPTSFVASEHLVEQQRKHEAKLKRKLDSTRRTNLKALCRYAAMLSRGEIGSNGQPLFAAGSNESSTGDRSKPTRGRPRGKKAKVKGQRQEHGDSQAHCDAEFVPGSLIRYAFQNEENAWVWYMGMVTSAWHKQSWHKVMFEYGEQMWVRLDSMSRGCMWKAVLPASSAHVAVETARFERSLAAASPEALEQLRIDLRISTDGRRKKEWYVPGKQKLFRMFIFFLSLCSSC